MSSEPLPLDSPTLPAETPPAKAPAKRPEWERPRARRRRIRRFRKLMRFVTALMPTIWMVWTDFVRRGQDIAAFPRNYKFSYAGGVAQSIVMWTLPLIVASRRRGFLGKLGWFGFLLTFTVVLGVESAFRAVWNVYLCIDGQLHSRSTWGSIWGTLPLARPLVIFHLVTTMIVGWVILRFARRYIKARPWTARSVAPWVFLTWSATLAIPVSYRGIQASPPDTLYAHGMAGYTKEHLAPYWPEFWKNHETITRVLDLHLDMPDRRVQRRDPEPVPRLTAKPSKKRNVVLILEESQRGDATCSSYDPRCPRSTVWSNAVLPHRVGLEQLHSNASTTAISISNIWSGVNPTESRELLHSVPLLWEYANAAGYDTAYWTSQNLMFGNARVYVEDLPISHGCVATHLDPAADLDTGAYDNLLTQWVKKDWPEMREPFFAVIHYSNPHYPYVEDPELEPFQPAEKNHEAGKNTELYNYYKDVVYLSDAAVGEMVRSIRASESGKRTVIIYTADHGESFREHWQMGHTSSLYEEETHVPGWIDAPEGTLSESEKESVTSAKSDYVWHLDLAPTFLDLMGVWDDPALAPFRARMPGHPITRHERTLAPLVMTNCTWVWECSFRNWGMMQGPRKIEAREWDHTYHCFDLDKDPGELFDLGERACAPLPDLAREIFHVMPNVTPPGKKATDWGQ